MIKLSLLTIALFSSISIQAAYVIKMPLEQKLGGHMQDNSIAFVGGIGSGSTPPVTPEPEPKPEVKPERKLVATLNFSTVSGETNIFTADQQNGFVLQTSTFVLKGALKHDQNYYITNNGNECKYNADVCTMNMNCVYSKSGLTGAYTILSISPSQAKACLNVVTNHFTGTKSLSNVTIYDNPKTE
ncbi:TPA: hypothetical protein ABHN85_19710 [Pseudomonas sp. H2]|uniref:hypothetical protein n=1 Tax=Pseudomonas sp. H2 TaxID=658612 RepID=UPI00126A0141|nr:hypothetical protein [Pseudomonas sp. H2]